MKPTINYKQIRKTLSNLVSFVTGVECILSEQTTPQSVRPRLPYFSFKMISPSIKSGNDSILMKGQTLSKTGLRKMVVSFQCFSHEHEESYELMSLLQAALELPSIQEFLRKQGLALWLNGSVTDLSQLLNTGYEARSQMDVQFGFTSQLNDTLSTIEFVEWSEPSLNEENQEISNDQLQS